MKKKLYLLWFLLALACLGSIGCQTKPLTPSTEFPVPDYVEDQPKK